jgi:hypothetical protein
MCFYTYLTNPASEYIIIQHSEGFEYVSDSNIKIYNTLGECVLNIDSDMGSVSKKIDISHLSCGTYFLKLTINQTIYSQKIIVK